MEASGVSDGAKFAMMYKGNACDGLHIGQISFAYHMHGVEKYDEQQVLRVQSRPDGAVVW